MSLLLLKTRPQIVIPELAARIGLNESLVLQQVQYWLTETDSGIKHEGRRWIYNTFEKWLEQFPYFSEKTLKRAFTSLKKIGVLSIEQLNKRNHDRTNYYAINYDHEVLNDHFDVDEKPAKPARKPSKIRIGQNDPIEQAKTDSSSGSNWPDRQSQNDPMDKVKMTRSLTESTTEITTESTTNLSCQVHDEPDETDPALQVLTHFNQVTNSNYREGKTTMGYIRGRLAEDYVASDLILVTDYLVAKWSKDPRMRDYLRPKTLFSPENCSEYFDKAKKWQEAGRPACVDGRWLKPGEVAVSVDTVARDEAFRRLICSSSKPKNRLEEIAAQLAGKSGIRRMTEVSAHAAWRGIWAKAAEQLAKKATCA
ncbi:conserved phage C-terminal domain-containing protein [Arsenophonus nasoniae]|uniref:Conserved phage C-terminal domain-containing protein n=1 Tax=Arsenophonus nasoniae TaxID=638 RepID=A0AA95K247_9GAMM|nr:conserved phage C-terminal domain-containing protein [Arsenophonus nasoniae]WGL96526.1 conserved phage C-terminal domain-containing protein [Arsenophonus nasoniae]